MMFNSAIMSAAKTAAVIATIVAMPLFLVSALAAVADFSKELVTIAVFAGLVITIGLAAIATAES